MNSVMADLHQELIRIINAKTPHDENPVDLLMTVLPLKKEAAYRRLRGEIPFTLEEAAQIAVRLDISLDQLLQLPKDGLYKATMLRMNNPNPLKAYCQTAGQVIDALRLVKSDPDARLISVTNLLPISYLFNYPALSKFRLFKFLYQCRAETTPQKMSDITIPPEVHHVEEAWCEEVRQVATRIIWTRDLFVSLASDLQYFLSAGLINGSEVEKIKEECFLSIDELERDAARGQMDTGKSLSVYLSDIYFDASYVVMESAHFKACSIGVFDVNYFSSIEPDLCDEMKRWIDSLMKYAILISRSGGIERVNFFNRQRMLVEQIG